MDGDVVHEDGERRAAGLDYREGSPAASRSEEEDRELVPRRRGPAALDLRLLRRRHVALVDPSLVDLSLVDPCRVGPSVADLGGPQPSRGSCLTCERCLRSFFKKALNRN